MVAKISAISLSFLVLLAALSGCISQNGSDNASHQIDEISAQFSAVNWSAYPSLSKEELGQLRYQIGRCDVAIGDYTGFEDNSATYSVDSLGKTRYDFTFSTHALSILAEKTPAYRELYGNAIDYLIQKMLDKDAWRDWTENNRTTNDGSTGPYNPDPIAWKNIMYSGYLASMIGFYECLTGDTKYDGDFTLVYNESLKFTYNHLTIMDAICRQMAENPYHGVCCEADSCFWICNQMGVLGIKLCDMFHGTQYSEVLPAWFEWAKNNYIVPPMETGLAPTLMYTVYSPSNDVMIPVPGSEVNILAALYMNPFDGDAARQIYDMLKTQYGRYDPIDGSAYFVQTIGGTNAIWKYMGFGLVDLMASIFGPFNQNPFGIWSSSAYYVMSDSDSTLAGLMAAKELGDIEMYGKVMSFVERCYQPEWSNGTLYYRIYHSEDSKFMNGILNSWILMARASEPGALYGLLNNFNPEKFGEPELRGVDYPSVEARACFYDRATGNLLVKLNVSREIGETSFRIVNLAPNSNIAVSVDGAPVEKLLKSDEKCELVLTCGAGEHCFIIHPM